MDKRPAPAAAEQSRDGPVSVRQGTADKRARRQNSTAAAAARTSALSEFQQALDESDSDSEGDGGMMGSANLLLTAATNMGVSRHVTTPKAHANAPRPRPAPLAPHLALRPLPFYFKAHACTPMLGS